MSESLYRWPSAAKFGRVVPKSKFYETANIPAAVRQNFVSYVQRIVWAFKLADETIHLRGDADVPEIQVFCIDAKADDVTEDVLAAIDKAIRFPIIFELNRHTDNREQTRMVAAYKQLTGATQRLSSYFTTGWQPVKAPRMPLPPALNLAGLYAGIVMPMLPIAIRPGEGLAEAAGRTEQARKIERELAVLRKGLQSEPQLNRKVDIRRQIRERTAKLMELTGRAALQQ